MKKTIAILCVLLARSVCLGATEYYTDVFEGVRDAMDWYYGGTPSSGSIPTAPAAISGTNTPLEDISDKVGTVSGLTASADGLSSQFASLDNNYAAIGGLADAALADMFSLPTDNGNLNEYSFGTFTLGSHSFEFKLDFVAWQAPIALMRGVILLLLTVGFLLTAATTIRGYL